MNATSFFLAHGEKIVVALVAGGCTCVLWNTFTDTSFRPKDNAQRVEEINRSIEEVFKTQIPPVMKEPRPYLDQLLARVNERTPVTPTMSWLTTLPDLGKDPVKGAFVYIYEVLAPSVLVKDEVGQMQLTLSLPVGGENDGGGRRISSAADRIWTRQDRGTVTNHARHLGIQVQVKVGKGDWKPLSLPGASTDGVLPLEDLSTEPIVMPALEPWATHTVRARLIVSATALDLGTSKERPTETVIVFAGQVSTGPVDDEQVIRTLGEQVNAKGGKLLDQALKAVDGPLPATAKLESTERVFLGPWSTVDNDSTDTITGNVRSALLGFTIEPLKEDPGKTRDVGKFLLVRLFQQDGEAKWLEKPLERRFGVGDRLQATDNVPNPFAPTQLIQCNCLTPFVIQALVKDQKRVLYWTIRAKSRQGGGKDRDLVVDSKEVPTDIVVLKNPDTGSELVLTKLISVNPPTTPGIVVFPYRAASQNERDDFVKAPSEFKQWGLVPEEPKAHKPGTGPLEELHQAKLADKALDAASYVTDTTYYELGDHRLVWWDLISKSMMKHDPKGIEAPVTITTPEAQPPVNPVTPAGPKGMPPGMPPGVGPDMPPGMPPGAPRR